jgi:hypothetical protein
MREQSKSRPLARKGGPDEAEKPTTLSLSAEDDIESERRDFARIRAYRIAYLEALGLRSTPLTDIEYIRHLAAWDRMLSEHYRPTRLWRRGEAA